MFKNTLYSSANNSIACSAAMAMAVHTVRTVSEHSARGSNDVAQEQHSPRTAG